MTQTKKKPTTKAKKYKSDVMRSVHSAMSDLAELGAIDKQTMRKFDVMCLTSVEDLSAKDIAEIRKDAGVSQGVFASYLNVKTNVVSQWERGERRPSGTAVKLLSLVKKKGLEAIA